MKNLLLLILLLTCQILASAQKTVTTKTVTTVRDKSGKVEKVDSSEISTTVIPEVVQVHDTVYLTATPPVVQPPVTPPPTDYPGYSLVYSTGYDSQADIVNGSNQLGQGSLSTSRYKTGPGSFRSLVNSSPASNISSGWRSEVQYSSSYSKDGDEIIVEYDTYYEKLFTTNGLNVQWHGNADGTSGQLSLWVQNGSFMVMRSVKAGVNNYQKGTLKKIQTGKWYNMRWHIQFSPSAGYVRLYIDDVLYFDSGNNVKTSDGTGQYLKVGTNRWNVSSESIVYFDNLKIWKKDRSTSLSGTLEKDYFTYASIPNAGSIEDFRQTSHWYEFADSGKVLAKFVCAVDHGNDPCPGLFLNKTGQQSVKRNFIWHGLDTTNPKPVLPPVPTDTTLLLSRADINQLLLLLGDKIQMPDGNVLMLSGNERDRISYLFQQEILVPAIRRWQKQNTPK